MSLPSCFSVFFLFRYFVFWIVLCIVNLTLKYISEREGEIEPWGRHNVLFISVKMSRWIDPLFTPTWIFIWFIVVCHSFKGLNQLAFSLCNYIENHFSLQIYLYESDVPLKCFQVAIDDEAWLNHSRNFYWISFWKKNVMSRNAKFSYLILAYMKCTVVKLHCNSCNKHLWNEIYGTRA